MQLAHGSGRCLITACSSDQLSADANEATGASTFTHYLAEALTSGAVDSDGDGVVLTSEIFKSDHEWRTRPAAVGSRACTAAVGAAPARAGVVRGAGAGFRRRNRCRLAPEEQRRHGRGAGQGGSAIATPPPLAALPPPLPPAVDAVAQALIGWWSNDAGSLHIELRGGALVYTDHNLLGVKVGQGALQVQSGMILVQGTNSFSGVYSGQLTLQGQVLTGALMIMGQTAPVSFMRQAPWFAGFVN